MKRLVALIAVTIMSLFCLTGISFAQAIENELYLITPVSKDVHDPSSEGLCRLGEKEIQRGREDQRHPQGYAGRLWPDPGVEGQAPGGRILGRRGHPVRRPGGQGLLEQVQLPKAMWDAVPASIGTPVPLPLKDPKKFWVGTTLEPYGIIYQPKLLKRLGVQIKTWDDLLNPKLKDQIAQCTPDRSSSSHASYEVILPDLRLGKGLGLADQAWRPTPASSPPARVTCRAWWPRANSRSASPSPATWPLPKSWAAMT